MSPFLRPASRKVLTGFAAILMVAVLALLALPQAAEARAPDIRVRLAEAASADIHGSMRYKGQSVSGSAQQLTVRAVGNSLRVGGKTEAGPLEITSRGETLRLGAHHYRGSFRLHAVGGRVQVVNIIGLDPYLASVLGSEMGAGWPLEALKAQAVVARSYTYARMQGSRSRNYDLDNTVLSQVYKGTTGEAARTRQAVAETGSRVLMHRGTVVEAFYHSACGGRTEDPSAIWKGNAASLQSVADPYCEASPDYFWVHRINYAELGRKFAMPPVHAVKVLSRAPGGRVLDMRLEAEGTTKTVDGDSIRRALGYNRLKSTLFEVAVDGQEFLFKGSGSGHGVGLCQWGARGQAEKGRDYQDILKHYFPSAQLRAL